jgi:hypothetical protein
MMDVMPASLSKPVIAFTALLLTNPTVSEHPNSVVTRLCDGFLASTQPAERLP